MQVNDKARLFLFISYILFCFNFYFYSSIPQTATLKINEITPIGSYDSIASNHIFYFIPKSLSIKLFLFYLSDKIIKTQKTTSNKYNISYYHKLFYTSITLSFQYYDQNEVKVFGEGENRYSFFV